MNVAHTNQPGEVVGDADGPKVDQPVPRQPAARYGMAEALQWVQINPRLTPPKTDEQGESRLHCTADTASIHPIH
jgi:hypothetical protein